MISTPAAIYRRNAAAIATNIRRLMARDGLTFDDVVQATGLDERTLRSLVRGRNNPHARTLHKLATGLGVEIDELFQLPGSSTRQHFDRATNTLVENVVLAHPHLFERWSEQDFEELYSRFGTGGQMRENGVLAAAEAITAKRELWRQMSVILESGEADLLRQFVDILYRRVTTIPRATDNGRQ